MINDYHNIHHGPVAILANGLSMIDALPYLDKYPTIGINASTKYWPSDYWVALDSPSIWRGITYPHKPKVLFTSPIPTPETDHLGIKKVDITSNFRRIGWSNDLREFIYPCRSTLWFAMQVGAWMGYDPLLLVGFDLKGPRPEGHIHEGQKIPYTAVQRQLQLMGYLKGLQELGRVETRIYNCSTISLCDALPRYSLREDKVVEENDNDVEVVYVDGDVEVRGRGDLVRLN